MKNRSGRGRQYAEKPKATDRKPQPLRGGSTIRKPRIALTTQIQDLVIYGHYEYDHTCDQIDPNKYHFLALRTRFYNVRECPLRLAGSSINHVESILLQLSTALCTFTWIEHRYITFFGMLSTIWATIPLLSNNQNRDPRDADWPIERGRE